MPSALSLDLRERVVGAVRAGASRHRAAERFGVSLGSASRWCAQFLSEGHVTPKPMGGDQRSRRIEANADLILSLYETQPGLFLRGIAVGPSGLSRFFKRRGITRKKTPATRLSRSGRT